MYPTLSREEKEKDRTRMNRTVIAETVICAGISAPPKDARAAELIVAIPLTPLGNVAAGREFLDGRESGMQKKGKACGPSSAFTSTTPNGAQLEYISGSRALGGASDGTTERRISSVVA